MLGRIHLLQVDKEKLAIIHHVAYDLRPGEQRRVDSPMDPLFPQRRNKSNNGSGCNNGSPPQNVTPSERSMKTVSFSISFIKASAEYSVPDISIAKAGHTSAQIPHRVQRAPSVTIPSGVSVNACCGQASTHVRQPMHFFSYRVFASGWRFLPDYDTIRTTGGILS